MMDGGIFKINVFDILMLTMMGKTLSTAQGFSKKGWAAEGRNGALWG